MYCDGCGVAFRAGQRFCGGCGKPIEGFVPGQGSGWGRVQRHVQTVGILTIAASILGLLWGSMLMNLGARGFFRAWSFPCPFFCIPRSFGVWILFSALAGLGAGWGLLHREPWARSLVLVMNTMALIYVPFGTMLGIYTLWVLLPRQSELEYRQFTRVA